MHTVRVFAISSSSFDALNKWCAFILLLEFFVDPHFDPNVLFYNISLSFIVMFY